MKYNKISNLQQLDPENTQQLNQYLRDLDDDIKNLSLLTQGRVSFGIGTDGFRGENISGEFQEFTTSATPDAENTIGHTVGSIPIGYIIMHQDKAGSLYQSPTTGTNWTATNVYLKSDVASVTFNVFLVKKG
jgi:hypothetical protein